MTLQRNIDETFNMWLPKKELILIYGARQIGKTTFLKRFVKKNNEQAIYINCGDPAMEEILSSRNLNRIKVLFGAYKYICLDDAQSIPQIGLILNLISDAFDQYKIIATGSSSFELGNSDMAPPTCGQVILRMFPLTVTELKANYDWSLVESNFRQTLVYGMYPGLIDLDQPAKKEQLSQISSDYMFKDILKHEDIRHAHLLRKILKAVAFRVGSELSTNNLAKEFAVTRSTIERYLDFLEKCFVIFALPCLKRDLGNELKKSKKYYFFDNGIRNALINNFTDIENRTDAEQLWENFCISEIIKNKFIHGEVENTYFWRTYSNAEIDLVIESQGAFDIWDCKWKPRRKPKISPSFLETYNVRSTGILTRDKLHTLLDI